MRFEDWDPIYQDIVQDMGYDRLRDEQSARMLSELLKTMEPSRLASCDDLQDLIYTKDVLVCGNAPCLKQELNDIDVHDLCIIAADGASRILMERDMVPDVIVTDLDGAVESEIEASRQGAIMVVHAHGDNLSIIRRVIPRLYHVIGSTQAEPLPNVHNFGGFTDGDRCVFLARQMGAASITLIGFDFQDDSVSDTKRKKLDWAQRLIAIALAQ